MAGASVEGEWASPLPAICDGKHWLELRLVEVGVRHFAKAKMVHMQPTGRDWMLAQRFGETGQFHENLSFELPGDPRGWTLRGSCRGSTPDGLFESNAVPDAVEGAQVTMSNPKSVGGGERS